MDKEIKEAQKELSKYEGQLKDLLSQQAQLDPSTPQKKVTAA